MKKTQPKVLYTREDLARAAFKQEQHLLPQSNFAPAPQNHQSFYPEYPSRFSDRHDSYYPPYGKELDDPYLLWDRDDEIYRDRYDWDRTPYGAQEYERNFTEDAPSYYRDRQSPQLDDFDRRSFSSFCTSRRPNSVIRRPDSQPLKEVQQPYQLHIANLPGYLNIPAVEQMVEPYGEVSHIDAATDNNGRPIPGVMTVYFTSEDSVSQCVKAFHGCVIGGKRLHCSTA